MPGRVRGGVVRRTGDRVGDALEMRTRRVGVEGFVVASLRCSVVASLRTGERSILLSFQAAPLPRFFLPRAALWALFFWAAEALIYGALMAHEYACTTSRCPLFLIGLGCRFSSLSPHAVGADAGPAD